MATTQKNTIPSAATDSKEQRRLQMADIARLAGVSTATVSRALSDSSLVNDETKTRIVELARSLNYSINIGAQNLRLKQSRTVAVVVPYENNTRQHLTDPFFLSMLGSIADALTERGFDMLLSRIDAARMDGVAQIYDTGRASGIILIGQWHHHHQLNQLAARHMPIVVWGAQLPQQLYMTVGSDNVSGGFLATEHLLQSGCKEIAFFGDTQLPEVAQRYQGYQNALTKYGIALQPKLVVQASFLENGGKLAVDELRQRQISFDGLFACSDLLAMTSINSLREKNYRVPEDIKVVGYDDIELARYFHPPLTTIRQSIVQAGNVLVETLLKLVENQDKEEPRLLATELVVRASSQS